MSYSRVKSTTLPYVRRQSTNLVLGWVLTDAQLERVEIFPIRIKLDYKPKRVNYMALQQGKVIELMNFFHFDGSDMTLRHAVLIGVSDSLLYQTHQRLPTSAQNMIRFLGIWARQDWSAVARYLDT